METMLLESFKIVNLHSESESFTIEIQYFQIYIYLKSIKDLTFDYTQKSTKILTFEIDQKEAICTENFKLFLRIIGLQFVKL